MSRDNLYLLLGVAVFALAYLILAVTTDWSFPGTFVVAVLISIASDIWIVFDNEHRNAAPDAKLHHRNERVGETATVTEDFRPVGDRYAGIITIHGESWRACAGEPDLNRGDVVRIIDRNGMTFTVKKYTCAAAGHGP